MWKSVVFNFQSLQESEQHHLSAEKEAHAIVEAISHWKHFLLGRHFTFITDQRSVANIYNYKS